MNDVQGLFSIWKPKDFFCHVFIIKELYQGRSIQTHKIYIMFGLLIPDRGAYLHAETGMFPIIREIPCPVSGRPLLGAALFIAGG